MGAQPAWKNAVLICDDGAVLFDSHVICGIPGWNAPDTSSFYRARRSFSCLRMQALAQGIADAGIAARWEECDGRLSCAGVDMHDAQVEKVAQHAIPGAGDRPA